MARFNSSLISNTITGTTSVGSPFNGSFTQLTGTAPYTVTLASPALFPGVNQQFYNATSGTVTLSTPSGNFTGAGGSAASTFPVYTGNVVSITADGTNYVVISEDGSALTATSATISGTLTVQSTGGVAIAPSATGSIDNVNIGATTRGSGAFNTLTSNNAVTFTANTSSSSTTTGTVVVTGGLGVSGTINAASVSASLTGTIQTAAQPNITSTGSLTIPGLTVDTTTLVVDATNDRVGVGTAGPGAVLHVVKTVQQTDFDNANQVLQLENTSTDTSGNVSGLRFRQTNGTNAANSFIGLSSTGDSSTRANLIFASPNTSGNATIRMRVNAYGQVFIGTTSTPYSGATGTGVYINGVSNNQPDLASLFVSGAKIGFAGIQSLVQNQLTVYDNTAGNPVGSGGAIAFGGNAGGGQGTYYAAIESRKDNGTAGAYGASLNFYTRPDSGYYTSPNMTISSSGNVGIGSTGPQTLLELATTASINSSNYGQIKHLTLSRQENTRYNAYAGFGDQFGGNTFGWRFGTVNNNADYPTLYMINGNVGIGTAASPVTRLQANTNTSMASSGSVVDVLSLTDNNGVSNGVTGARIGLTISAQSDITDRRIGIYATANTANFNAPDITFWASGQGIAYRELVRFSAQNGNVGINTGANPSAKLHIISTSTTTGLKVTSSNDWGNISAPFIDFDGNANGNGDGNILRVKTGAARNDVEIFEVQNGNGTQFLVRGDGNVGIGRTDLAYKLDVNGFARMSSYLVGSTNSTVRLAHIFQGPDLPGSFNIVTNDTGTITQKSAQITTASAGGTTFFFGPYYDLGPGNYQAKFRIKVASNSGSSYMGYIDCVGTNIANGQTTTITPNLFTASNQYQYINLTFTVTAAGGYLETRWINWQPVTNTSIDHILIIPL